MQQYFRADRRDWPRCLRREEVYGRLLVFYAVMVLYLSAGTHLAAGPASCSIRRHMYVRIHSFPTWAVAAGWVQGHSMSAQWPILGPSVAEQHRGVPGLVGLAPGGILGMVTMVCAGLSGLHVGAHPFGTSPRLETAKYAQRPEANPSGFSLTRPLLSARPIRLQKDRIVRSRCLVYACRMLV